VNAAAPSPTDKLMISESSCAGGLPPDGLARAVGETGCTPATKENFRLASGIFYEPPRLGCAIGDLLAGGYRRREMCLAGTRTALGNAKALPVPTRQLRPLYALATTVEIMGTSGVLLRKLLKQAAWREGESNLASAWLLPELFGRFTDHIRGNAIVLLLSAADPALQHQGCRILLRHSTHTVQTHEFSLARSAGL
jgi:hypothetical protein